MLELSTLYGLHKFSLITLTYVECNLPFYFQTPSKGRSSVTLQSVYPEQFHILYFVYMLVQSLNSYS